MRAAPGVGGSDRAAVVQAGDLVGGEAGGGQRGVGVLAERRAAGRAATGSLARRAASRRRTGVRSTRGAGVVVELDHRRRGPARCGSSSRSSTVRTGPTAAPASASCASHSAAGFGGEHRRQLVGQRRLPSGRGRPAGRRGRAVRQRRAERRPGARLGGGQRDQLAVGGAVGAPRSPLRPIRPGCPAATRATASPITQVAAVDDAGVDERALPGAVALGERGEDADHRDRASRTAPRARSRAWAARCRPPSAS